MEFWLNLGVTLRNQKLISSKLDQRCEFNNKHATFSDHPPNNKCYAGGCYATLCESRNILIGCGDRNDKLVIG